METEINDRIVSLGGGHKFVNSGVCRVCRTKDGDIKIYPPQHNVIKGQK